VEQEFFAVGSTHTYHPIRPAVFDPLVLGLQHLDRLGIEAEETACQIGREPLEHSAADDVFPDLSAWSYL